MDWLKFYGLKGEPFGPQPLRRPDEFQDVFVMTDAIKIEVDPIIPNYAHNCRNKEILTDDSTKTH